jgi:molybdopterin-guanine dinucleotide biosynthesis protein A
MGRDKAQLRLGRRTLLGHVRRTAESLGVEVRIIREDIVPRCGPLGGIYTGLKTSTHEAELFLSCDMPFVTADLLKRLMRAKCPVFVEHDRGIGFPFMLSVADVGVVEQEIQAGRLSLQNLAKRLRARRLRVNDAQQLLNVNTPTEWEEARQRRAELAL